MHRRLLSILSITFLTVGLTSSMTIASAADCPDFSKFDKTTMTLVPYSNSDFQRDLPSASKSDDLTSIGIQIESGEPVFRALNMYPMWDPELLNLIKEKGTDIAVYYYPVRSTNGTNWKRLSRAYWDFMDDEEKNSLTAEYNSAGPTQSSVTTISRPQIRTGISLLRQGLTPGTKGATAVEISVRGCPTKTIYTKQFTVPNFELKSKSIESFLENEIKYSPYPAPNFKAQEECISTFNSLLTAAKSASSKSANWSMPPSQRGLLDLRWKPTGESLCENDGPITIQPSFGDQCLKRLDPGGSTFRYQTLKIPCKVSLDIRSRTNVELATFTISKPAESTIPPKKIVTITCTNGKISRSASGTNPLCPKGFKRK